MEQFLNETTTVASLTDWQTFFHQTVPNTTVKCNQYVLKNKTHIIYGGYEGIPENLLINVIGWICLLSLFTVLRKRAWNYGRLALVQKLDTRWTQLFYGAETDASMTSTAPNGCEDADSVSSYEFNRHLDTGTFSWMTALFKIKDEHVLQKSGRDAVHYLSFQRHMIAYLAIVCVICIVVVLPINFQGTLEGDEKEFGHTTISNLSPSSPYMWVHITLAFLFLPLGIAFTRHHSRLLNFNQGDLDPNVSESESEISSVARTVMITHVPRRSCHKDTLLKHFQEAYPDVDVMDLQFAYSIKKLIAYDKEKELVRRARLYCEDYLQKNGERLHMRPYTCGVVCVCCDFFGRPQVDALDYYTKLEAALQRRVEEEKIRALRSPTGVAFVTLESRESAMKVIRDHQQVPCRCLGEPPASSVSSELKPHNWSVTLAPAPSNIYWKNLSVTTRHWWAKAFLINLVLFVILFFLTTPAMIINSLDFIILADQLQKMSPLLSEFLPTMLLWTIAALMPVLVAYSDQFMSHWTRSAENHAVMRKTFIFLLFMVIILPSLGLTSAKALVEWLANYKQPNSSSTYRWECIFLPDNGAFFVNYIITSAFIGTSLELIRFPELFMYMIRLCLSRSEAETSNVRRVILYEFQFGVQYAYMLLIFAMTTIYSISCPLITPFGLLYLCFKHLVDKYNIYFAYGPSRISKNIHATAVHFVMVSIVLLQLCLLFFSIVRQGIQKPRTIYSIVLFSITLFTYFVNMGLHWFQDLSPIDFKSSLGLDSESVKDSGDMTSGLSSFGPGERHDTGHFVPDVLKDTSSAAPTSSYPGASNTSGNGSASWDETRSTTVSTGREEDRFYSGGGRSYGTGNPTPLTPLTDAQQNGYQNYVTQQSVATLTAIPSDYEPEEVIFDASSAHDSPVPSYLYVHEHNLTHEDVGATEASSKNPIIVPSLSQPPPNSRRGQRDGNKIEVALGDETNTLSNDEASDRLTRV